MSETQRYAQIFSIIDEIKPRSIIEIGVARTVRAREMSERALEFGKPVHYTGYDVFETVNAAFHEAAYNHKRVEPEHWCARKLWHIQQRHPLFTFDLVVGDTRKTLHGKTVRADLAFIDGDHRAEVIRGDYLALSACKVVVFDDYFEPDERGMPDVAKYGCNAVVGEIKALGIKVELLPHADKGRDKGVSRLAVVRR